MDNKKLTNLSYGEALKLLNHGYRVRRASWAAKGMWVYLIPEQYIAGHDHLTAELCNFAINECIHVMHACFVLKNKTGKLHYGWLATHCDQLANDWEIVRG